MFTLNNKLISVKNSNLLNLMTTRQLPPRKNRGKNTFYTIQIEKIQDEKTRTSVIRGKKPRQTIGSQELQKKQKDGVQSRRDMFNENKKIYKYTRGIHYFFDLSSLQRVPGSVSYVAFPSKKQSKLTKTTPYTVTYSQDTQLLGTSPISSLINRNFIGLPRNPTFQVESTLQQQNGFVFNQKSLKEVIELKKNDKNQCHHYLFEAEDKKHNLDRMIKQLEFVEKRLEYFLKDENLGKLRKFGVVEKDNELAEVLLGAGAEEESSGESEGWENDEEGSPCEQQDQEYTFEQKRQLLNDKISNLKEKRLKLNTLYSTISQTYFHNSLDQLLFNQTKQQKQKLNRFSIYHQMQKSIKQHQNPSPTPQNIVILENFHNFHYNNLQSAYSSFASQVDDYYCIDEKVLDPFVMEKAFRLVSIRLFQEGENCFYFGKKMFMRLFRKEVRLEKEIKAVTFEQYCVKGKEIVDCLGKFWGKRGGSGGKGDNGEGRVGLDGCCWEGTSNGTSNLKKNNKKPITTANRKALFPTPKQSIKLQLHQKFTQIRFYQFYCLKLFLTIYQSLYTIRQFLHRTQNKRLNIIQHLASLHYPKIENNLMCIIQVPKFGLLTEALDKLVDVILHPKKEFEVMNYELFVQYVEGDRQILTFLKEIESPEGSVEGDGEEGYKRELGEFEGQVDIGGEEGGVDDQDKGEVFNSRNGRKKLKIK